MMKPPVRFTLALLLGSVAVFAADPVRVPEPDAVIAALHPGHPRLMLDDAGLERLRQTIRTDATARRYYEAILQQAGRMLDEPVLSYQVAEGRRLMSVARRCIDRMYTLGLAWRLTGDRRFAEKAEKDLLAVTALENWTPSLAIIYPLQDKHRLYEEQYRQPAYSFLDVAEMSHAVGIGYDWFHAFLSPASRAVIRSGLIAKGLALGVSAYTGRGTVTGRPADWTTYDHNWNMVCNGGLIVGALAVADTDPEFARTIIPGAVKSLPLALTTYGPDGAWPEGPSYWHYATRYAVYAFDALQAALGTDFGLSDIPGLSRTGSFPLLTTGPTGLYLNFADSAERNALESIPCLFWLARRYQNTFYSDREHAMLRREQPHAHHLIWYVPPGSGAAAPAERDARFRGPTEVAVFRSSWDDPGALFVGVKAGDNGFNHAHLDLGTFELDALGVRWARDLGSDDYALPGYFDFHYLTRRTGGERWDYFRLGSLSHNIPILEGGHQDELAKARFTRFHTDDAGGRVVVDLTKAYARHAARAHRGIATVDSRRAVLVVDEFDLTTPASVVWNMMTDADITLDGSRAVLRQEGETLIAKVLEPAGASFSARPATQPPPQRTNAGVRHLEVRVPGRPGNLRIAVLLSPRWPDGTPTETASIAPLAEW